MTPQEIISKVRRIEIKTRRHVDEMTAGAYHSAFKGRGMEFSDVREYLPGDEIRSIDWNVSARTGKTHIKQFVEERELNIHILADISASGDIHSGQGSKSLCATEILAIIAFSALRNKDRVGLTLFSDCDELHLPARKGKQHCLRMIRELLVHERKSVQTDLTHALSSAYKSIKRRSLIFLISDLMDEDYEKQLRLLSKKHEVIIIHVSDPIEKELPALPKLKIEDSESQEQSYLHGHWQGTESFEEKKQLCLKSGAAYIHVSSQDDPVPPLMAYFKQRQRRIH